VLHQVGSPTRQKIRQSLWTVLSQILSAEAGQGDPQKIFEEGNQGNLSLPRQSITSHGQADIGFFAEKQVAFASFHVFLVRHAGA